MKLAKLDRVKLGKFYPFLLTSLAAGLIFIYLTLVLRAKYLSLVGMSALFFLVVGSLLWEKRHKLNFESSIIERFLGALLIGGTLANLPLYLSPKEIDQNPYLLLISPFIFAIGLAWLASGFKKINQYWRELTILFFLTIPKLIIGRFVNPSVITAKFSAFLLWFVDIYVSRIEAVPRGAKVYIPTTVVKVWGACSGLEMMGHLLGISVIMLLLFPLKRIYYILVPIMAISLGFIVNGFRVAILIVLAGYKNWEVYKYWHVGEGSLIFVLIAAVIFVVFYFLLIRYTNLGNWESTET